MSDASLIQLADDIKGSCIRDLDELSEFGVSQPDIDDLAAARLVFSNCPTDEILSARIMAITQTKKATHSNLIEEIRKIADRARIKYGEDDRMFNLYGVEMLSKQLDNDLVHTGRRVVMIASEQLTELISEGLTQIKIDLVQSLTASFDSLIDQQLTAIRRRDYAVDVRIEAGNHLYSLITKLAAKGKLTFSTSSEARYNDYVINKSTKSRTYVTEAEVGSNQVVTISINNISSSDKFTIINTGQSFLNFYFSANPFDESSPAQLRIGSGKRKTIKAVDIGFELGTRERFNVFNPGEEAGSYRVEWD